MIALSWVEKKHHHMGCSKSTCRSSQTFPLKIHIRIKVEINCSLADFKFSKLNHSVFGH